MRKKTFWITLGLGAAGVAALFMWKTTAQLPTGSVPPGGPRRRAAENGW